MTPDFDIRHFGPRLQIATIALVGLLADRTPHPRPRALAAILDASGMPDKTATNLLATLDRYGLISRIGVRRDQPAITTLGERWIKSPDCPDWLRQPP